MYPGIKWPRLERLLLFVGYDFLFAATFERVSQTDTM